MLPVRMMRAKTSSPQVADAKVKASIGIAVSRLKASFKNLIVIFVGPYITVQRSMFQGGPVLFIFHLFGFWCDLKSAGMPGRPAPPSTSARGRTMRSEEHTSELQSLRH